jgi:regulator of RNase E activity RraB
MTDHLKENSQFVSETQHLENISSQLTMSPLTLKQLKTHGVTGEKELKLEFFFYTNTPKKAAGLHRELIKLGYSSEFGDSAADDNTLIITGWSLPIVMSPDNVEDWVKKMCNIGYAHDCLFDGWGTYGE